ncbi:MAG TPA: hypothetical protein VLS89_00080, partial [Candidatus Nanopelagicales bacterium]|nr:hypothetical protein [Candidatus Nanopelagicales bacterium]
LLLSDVVLSDTTGVALALELTALGPGLAVIFMSGHPRETLEERFQLPADALLVEKPIDFDELERRVDEMLRAARRVSL